MSLPFGEWICKINSVPPYAAIAGVCYDSWILGGEEHHPDFRTDCGGLLPTGVWGTGKGQQWASGSGIAEALCSV